MGAPIIRNVRCRMVRPSEMSMKELIDKVERDNGIKQPDKPIFEIALITSFALIIVGFVLLALFLISCVSVDPEPIVIERNCIMPEPYEKPKLTKVKYLKQGEEGCTYFRCLTEEEAKNASKREATLTSFANSLLELYNINRAKCSDLPASNS